MLEGAGRPSPSRYDPYSGGEGVATESGGRSSLSLKSVPWSAGSYMGVTPSPVGNEFVMFGTWICSTYLPPPLLPPPTPNILFIILFDSFYLEVFPFPPATATMCGVVPSELEQSSSLGSHTTLEQCCHKGEENLSKLGLDMFYPLLVTFPHSGH